MPGKISTLSLSVATLAVLLPAPIGAQDGRDFGARSSTYNQYGAPGLLDMPSAETADDAELATTLSYSAAARRVTMSFQITPRLSASFRYGQIPRYLASGAASYDRSFDLRYRLIDEGAYRPAVVVGFQDLAGTGLYSGEYVVATKHVSSRLAFTAGIGWGRLGSYNGFRNPLGRIDGRFYTRPAAGTATGGTFRSGQWFRGDAAFFGGVTYRATDRLTLKAEYSSDAYAAETTPARNLLDRKSSLNVGLSYRAAPGVDVQLAYMYGDMIAAGVTFYTNPRKTSVPGGSGPAPVPVKPRDMKSAQALGWTTNDVLKTKLRDGVAAAMAADGIQVEGLRLEDRVATIYIRNERYIARAEAIGRTARVLTQVAPASIDSFRIVPMVQGVPASVVTLQRRDLEQLEHDPDGAWRMFARADIADRLTGPAAEDRVPDQTPRLTWSLGPYVKASYFDPAEPVRLDAGLRLRGKAHLGQGFVLSAEVDQRVAGNRGDSNRFDPSALPRVRSDANLYAKADTTLNHLTLASYFRPGENLYGRVTAGYLEPMFAGVSAELLWKPVDSRFALGVEANYVQQRDFDQKLGLRSYRVATGHVSAYYDFGNGFHGQADVGRYLAGDWGGTVSLDREFANGWRIGAYATFTDVSFSDFGEGSFDKGIRFSIPLDHFLGRPTGRTQDVVLQPLSRDGGARLKVDGRIYDQIRDYHEPELKKSWGRFWR
ncbi:hypothetical protein GCM10011360_27660 [Primorskyibacter flagellatus]|uniref:Exopolysaccharide biosynthesis protein YbjH n=1 Tax=Primorskyibacter flagellatus TaxID=1387277 RepID=A0A917EI28_9RHOB|nr:YjbH domain-containing protein [Primorskyibacter flagellatus]GGE38330.1 hypothetical protein GCM10011360_27660 [Primorskyibacter flagellatus]